jgi:hypothetical protein
LADAAGAEVLFQQARELLEQGRTEEACVRFEESQQLDPSSGTLINLASCHEKLGKTATAWAEFLATSRLALSQGRPDRAQEADRRAADLALRLSRLTISVGSRPSGFVVTRNGTPVAALGVAIPVDPGSYSISAAAPGYQDWNTTIDIAGDGEEKQVEIPPLVPLPKSPPSAPRADFWAPPTPARDSRAPSSSSRSLPAGFWVSAGSSVAAIAVGSVFGGLSLSSYNSANGTCPQRMDCSSEALQARDRAEVQANVANVAFATAAVSAGIATWLFFTR